MKKFASILSIALAAGFLSSCTEDFKDWANPQSNDPEAPYEVVFTAANAPAVDFNVTPETGNLIPVFVPTVTANVEGTTTIYNCEFHNADKTKSVKVPVNGLGEAFDDEVVSAVIKLYGTASEQHVVPLTITAFTKCNGQAVVNKVETCTFTVTTVPVPVPEVWFMSGNSVGNATGSRFAEGCVPMYPNPDNYEEILFAGKFTADTYFRIYQKEGDRYPYIAEKDGKPFVVNDAEAAGTAQDFKPGLDGYYKVTLNVKNLTISYEPLEAPEVFTCMAMPGSWQANAWSPGEDLMTAETTAPGLENHDWSATVTFATDSEFKFCANGSWCGFDWGSLTFPIGYCNVGDNIKATAGTYKVIFNDILKVFYFQEAE